MRETKIKFKVKNNSNNSSGFTPTPTLALLPSFFRLIGFIKLIFHKSGFFHNPKLRQQKTTPKLVSGFSLVETLIYVFLIVLLTLSVVNSLVFMTKSYRDIRSVKSINLSANTLLNRFSYEVKRANNLSGTFGTATSTLILTQGVNTLIFSLEASSSRVIISTNGIKDYLTSAETKVTALTFLKLQATSTSYGAVIQFTISNSSGNNVKTENFESSDVLRHFSI